MPQHRGYYRKQLAALLLLGWSAGGETRAMAQAAVLRPVPGQGAFDRLERTPAVSGAGIAGVMLVGDQKPLRRQLWLRCFGSCVGRIEITAKSADSRWRGMAIVDAGTAPLPPRTWVRVDLPLATDPATAAIRDNLADDAIAVLARPVGAGNIGTGSARLLTAWSAGPAVPPSGTLVQVSLTARQLVTARLGGSAAIACQPVAERQPRAFNHVCRVPLADLEKLARPGVMLERDEGGSIQPNPVPLG
jgi:hypothetical protein